MKLSKHHLFIVFFLLNIPIQAQEKTFKIHTIAFYNLENLFDAIDDPKKLDEYSPIMEIKTNREDVYKKKIKNMARVIADIGFDTSKNSPSIIGLCEIENKIVLEDLVNDTSLIKKDYGIIHFEGPDVRGIDVALLFQKKAFIPLNSSTFELKIYDNENQKRIYTRDQLLVSGQLEGELIHIIVNHWPSRRGGESRSKAKRIAAAKLNKHIIDSLQNNNPYAKIFVMGDLNDNPTNSSIKKVLKAKEKKSKVGLKGIYNPFTKFYKNGLGTTAYRDSWSLFDQIMITKPLIDKNYDSFRFYKAGIYNKNYLITKKGKYKGYPLRSFSNGSFNNGFSDHFPVYLQVIKKVSLP